MKVTNQLLDGTQDQIDTTMNNLFLSVYDFSKKVCDGGAAYGVRTGDRCSMYFNPCARQDMVRSVVRANQRAIAELRYYPDRTAVSERVQLNEKWLTRFPLKYPGIDVLGSEAREAVFTDVTVPPYLETVTPEMSGGRLTVLLDNALVSNPQDVVLRRVSNGDVVTLDWSVRPVREVNGWRVALNNEMQSSNAEDLNVQHLRYVVVETDISELENVFPVFPGTFQKIPYLFRRVVGATWQWFIPVYLLMDEAFFHDEMDWLGGEVWKLLPTINFYRFYETMRTTATVTFKNHAACQDCPTTVQYECEISILDNENSWVELCYPKRNAEGEVIRYDFLRPLYVDFDYVVDIQRYVDRANIDRSGVRSAIANLAAAEIEVEECGCEINRKDDRSFIVKAQQTYTTIYGNEGTIAEGFRYGNKHGQKYFDDYLGRAWRWKRAVQI